MIELLVKVSKTVMFLPSLNLGGQRSLPLHLPRERRACRRTRKKNRTNVTSRSFELREAELRSRGRVRVLGGVSTHTSASRSAFPGLPLHACGFLMGRSQPGLRWDAVVRQTYSTTQIKINKQSEVFNPKHCSPPRALPCFFLFFLPRALFFQ